METGDEEEEESVAAIGVALENVTENGEGDLEEGGDISKAGDDLVFIQTVDGVPVDDQEAINNATEGSSAAVFRKRNRQNNAMSTTVRSEDEAKNHHDVLRQQPEPTEGTVSPAESISDDVAGGDAAASDEDNIEIGRIGRAMSRVKARVTGYRQALLPGEDGSTATTPPRMPLTASESEDAQEGLTESMEGRPRRRLNSSYGQLPNSPENNESGASTEAGDSITPAANSASSSSTPADGKTID
mgnify:CR=1 FL=1